MKKYLLPDQGNFYKANLHCHSTLSDGKLTVEEIKEEYMKRGYSVIAFTDHDIFLSHNDLTDENFLALNGFEVEINEEAPKNWEYRKCCHICYVALDEGKIIQPMWNENYLFGNAVKHKDKVQFDKDLPPYERKFDGESLSQMMKIGRDEGFFVTYNHPTWSMETYGEYINYENMNAFEIFNGSCLANGFDDYNPRVYDDILRSGKRIFCIGADDNHNEHPRSSRRWDAGRGFTVIKATELKYKTVTDALVNGDFYCSEAPEITALWVEDGKIHIDCPNADRVFITCGRRRGDIVYAENGGTIHSAEFPIYKEDIYVRLTVVDKNGYHACTNAYFTDELFED